MSLDFPTTVFAKDEWALRLRSAHLMRSPGEDEAFWLGETARFTVRWRGGSKGARLESVEFSGSRGERWFWKKGSLEEFGTSCGLAFPYAQVRERLRVLLGGTIPQLGTHVRVDTDSQPYTVFWLGAHETGLGVMVRVRDGRGTQHEFALARLHIVDAPVLADEALQAFAPGQPVLHQGRPAIIERVMRGRFDDVRLSVKPLDRSGLWCGPRDVTPLEGWTPMHSAALRDDGSAIAALPTEMINVPVKYPPGFGYIPTSVDTRHFNGMTPLGVAAAMPRLTALVRLMELGAPLLDEHLIALGRGGPEAAEVLVARGHGARLLSLAMQSSVSAQLLVGALAAGFDPDETLPRGGTLRETINTPRFRMQFNKQELKSIDRALRDEPLHVVRPAPSSHGKCVSCGKKILKQTPQFGLGEAHGEAIRRTWFHVECARALHPHNVAEAERA